MKLFGTLAVGAALVAGAAAQSLGDLPTCAANCATNALPKSCATVDIKCICTTKSFIESITCCVAKACDAADIQATLQFADELCGTVGVTTLPQSATCPSSTTSATATGSSTTSTTSVSAATGSPSSASSAPATETTGSTVSIPSSPNNPTAPTASSSGSSSSSSAASSSSSTAAAPIVHGQHGEVLAAVGGAAAFIAALL